ncbi:MAG: hypothetical protein F4Y91_05240 [Gemmatimonadetes bacterium]|nr:hypothetical protein [Gemmatimonadota bacterium]MXY81472.1 hypothetical protein [Gemmatimonadota bacterium]MYB68876.1 hypothetical protein [Gemmatimonadota bacterium]
MRRTAWVAWASLMAVGVVGAEPVAVVPVTPKPTLDGILIEWGAPERIGLVPGGERVGVRGAFTGSSDHEADLYLMWDADYVYVAAAVVDDIVDAQQIPPDKSEWRGPSGERKDAMFYYDHLKIFLRGPEQPLGHTIWLSPANGTPYLWGGMQRRKPTELAPVKAGGALRDQLYTFEVGIPWRWLGFYPQPDMVLDALFLLPDSDLPNEELRDKVRQSNKWIWWQGKVQLKGQPPGLRLLPPKQQVIAEIAEKTREIAVPKVAVREERAEKKELEQQDSIAVEKSPGAQREIPAQAPSRDSGPNRSQEAVQTESVPTIRSRLNRSLLAKRHPAPDWVRALNDDAGVSRGQVDSLYYRLTHSLARLTADRINARTDGIIMDLAEYAGTWRAQAQHFLQQLLAKTLADLEQGRLQEQIANAAAEVGVDGDQATRLVQSLCREALKIYADGKVASSETLIDKARRRAKLSEEQAQDLLAVLAASITQ